MAATEKGSPGTALTSDADRLGVDPNTALVLGVARLGEAELQGWWRCHCLDRTGKWVLGGSFPRTWRCVAMELDLLSATRRHHDIFPRQTALHLFSDALPFRGLAGAWLAEQKTVSSTPFLDLLAAWDVRAARAALAQWAAHDHDGQAERVGPALFLGSIGRTAVHDDDVLLGVCARLAAAYVEQGNELTPPYFDLDQ